MLDHTHDPAARSWVGVGQRRRRRLPASRTCRSACSGAPAAASPGAAASPSATRCWISRRCAHGPLAAALQSVVEAGAGRALNPLMALGRPRGARCGTACSTCCSNAGALARCGRGLPACRGARSSTRCRRASATTPTSTPSIHHATQHRQAVPARQSAAAQLQVGADRLPRPRLVASASRGQAFRRPNGQRMPPGDDAPAFGPCARLDYELELGVFIGPGNALGEPHPDRPRPTTHIFGLCLLNDWSARDIQAWEMAAARARSTPRTSRRRSRRGSSRWTRSSRSARRATRPAATRSRWPISMRPTTARAARSTSGSRCNCRPSRCATRARRRADLAHELRAPLLDGRRRWSRTTPAAAATCSPATCWAAARSPARRVDEAGAMMELALRRHAAGRAAESGETRSFLQDGDAVVFKGWCEARRLRAHRLRLERGRVLPAL